MTTNHQPYIQVLGSGTCVPSSTHASPAYFLKTHDLDILIDIGPGTLRQVSIAGHDIFDIDIVVISHLHPDHVSDFASLLQALKWTPERSRSKPLYIVAHPLFVEWLSDYRKVFNTEPQPDSFEVKIITQRKFTLSDFQITTHQGNHTESSIMTKFFINEKVISFTGDTGFDENLVKFAKNSDLLITECSYPSDIESGGHLTPVTVKRLLENSIPKKAIIGHLYPTVLRDPNLSKLTKIKNIEVVIASDFLKVGL